MIAQIRLQQTSFSVKYLKKSPRDMQSDAEAFIEDIEKGRSILEHNPAPVPDDRLTDSIKADLARALARRKRLLRTRRPALAAAAAVILVFSILAVHMFNTARKPSPPVMSARIWESTDLSADDPQLALFTEQLDQIESELVALRLGGTAANGTYDLTEVEEELLEINNSFWKG